MNNKIGKLSITTLHRRSVETINLHVFINAKSPTLWRQSLSRLLILPFRRHTRSGLVSQTELSTPVPRNGTHKTATSGKPSSWFLLWRYVCACLHRRRIRARNPAYRKDQRIKASAKGKAAKIIALTASSFDDEKEQILSARCDDFLRKPFREAALFELMRKHLGVELIYETQTPIGVTSPDAAKIAALSVEIRNQLQLALQNLDDRAIDNIIERIRNDDPDLGESLHMLAKDFQYGRLLALLQNTKG